MVRPFKDAVDGQPLVVFAPPEANLVAALKHLVQLYPKLGEHLLEGGELSPYVNVYRNGTAVHVDEAHKVSLVDGDELMFLLPMTGGHGNG